MTQTPSPPPEQLSLAWPHPEAMGAADFMQAPSNARALAAVTAGTLPGGALVISGPPGAGKTHLAAIWTEATGAAWVPVDTLPQVLPGLVAQGAPGAHPTPLAIAIDDADRLAATPEGQEALFHLLNHLRGRGQILMTAASPARDWGLTLPDLHSRLSAAANIPIEHPDEALLSAVLVKLFADRQVHVQPALIAYLVARMERSLSAARAMVARLDALALARGKPVTRALAAEILDANVTPTALDNT